MNILHCLVLACSNSKSSPSRLLGARLESAVALQVFVCRSGSAADTQAITAYVQYYLHQHQMELNNEILVKTAASFATRMVYSNKAGPVAACYCDMCIDPFLTLT